MNKKFCIFVFFIFAITTSYAAPFKNLETYIILPNGVELKLLASGDEFYHWVHDENGYTIVKGEDGYCYYADLDDSGNIIPSSYRVDIVSGIEAGVKPWLKISTVEYENRRSLYTDPLRTRSNTQTRAPHTGLLNNIVVFISFPDATEFSKARSVYDSRLNSLTSTSGSLKDYYLEASYNNLEIKSHLYPIALSSAKNVGYVDFHNRGYYQPYNATTNPIGYQTQEEYTNREHNLVVSAVSGVKSAIEQDFTAEELDADGDGLVDNICFIVQGNSDGWSDLLWAHRWTLYTRDFYIHNKKVYDYVFQPENQVVTKTLCHEMFHALGAPDLYHYDERYTNLDPIGDWDLMHSGWCHMGAYMKWRYAGQKWMPEMPLITSSGTYELSPISESPSCFKVNSTNPNEYFVLEYRLKGGKYEKNLSRSGLLIYRINTTVKQGNRNGPPDEVYIYRPYGSLVENGNLNEAAYLPTSGVVMSDRTFPKPFLSDNSDGGLRISNIVLDNGRIKFDIDITTTGLVDSSMQKEMRITVANKDLLVEGVDIIDEIIIYNTSGNICQRIFDSNTISLGNLPEGVYIVNVVSNNNVYKEKIIVR